MILHRVSQGAAFLLLGALSSNARGQVVTGNGWPDAEKVTVIETYRGMDGLNASAYQGLETPGLEALARRSPVLQAIAIDPTQTDFVVRGMVSGKTGFEKIQTRALVGLFLDDVPIALSGYNPNFRLVDIDHTEIQAGPQSVRYGQTAATGAVQIVTKAVDLSASSTQLEVNGAQAQYGVAGGGGAVTANAVLVPGQIAVRLVGYAQRDGGYLDNTVLGKTHTNGANTIGGRGKLAFQLNPDMALDVMAAYQAIDEEDSFASSQAAGGFYRRNTLRLEPTTSRNAVASARLSRHLGDIDLTASLSFTSVKNHVAPEIGGETAFFAHFLNPAVAVPVYDTPLATATRAEGIVARLDLHSHNEAGVQWRAGLAVSRDHRGLSQTIDVPGFDALTGFNSTAFGVPANRLFDAELAYSTQETSAYAEVNAPLAEKWHLTAGLRAYHAVVKGQIDFRGVGQGGVDQRAPRSTNDDVAPQIEVRYDPEADTQLYARIAKGYRLGGFNTFVSPVVCGPDLAALGLSAAPPTFQSDHIWSYEAGGETSLNDGRITVRGDMYLQEWNNAQTELQLQCGSNTILNGGHINSRGAEISALWHVGQALTIMATGTYTNSHFGGGIPSAQIPAGTKTPFTPEFAAALSARYDVMLAGTPVFAAVDTQYVGDRFNDADISQRRLMPEYEKSSLRVGATAGAWRLSVDIDNIFGTAGVLSDANFPFSHFPGHRITYTRPRSFGLAASTTFQ